MSSAREETILVVDPDPQAAARAAVRLGELGYSILMARSGDAALRITHQIAPQLVVLDLDVRDCPGTQVCRLIRATRAIATLPILIHTARASELDRIVAFELGADDYLIKPANPRELHLRAQAIIRRANGRVAAPLPPLMRVNERIELDPSAYLCRVDGRRVHLTLHEFRLLLHLHDACGSAVTRREIIARVWKPSAKVNARTLDTHIRSLRHKLGGAAPLIETVRNGGYRLKVCAAQPADH